ncbi:hypothetical protein BDV96DRAFT_644525 [Lophiotrema nucula]|uniref:Uncharacterized protein n=1 Tax=Lophiotrema nucula TaxID=690887 RepID=A0A6A5ZC89_9PLEO|nr:hypothetical protein BDV96DRAFT_644525 [Lophiotrema nucula]
MVQIVKAQAAKFEQSHRGAEGAGGKINGTDFHRGDIIDGSSTLSNGPAQTIALTAEPKPTNPTTMPEGFIGAIPTSSPTTNDEGYIGPMETPQSSAIPVPPTGPQFPIFALSYDGSGGPKHCRGELVQKLNLPPPASAWKNGTCIDLPKMARCGVFFAGKDDHCEAQLFNMESCLNTTQSFVNTVVFMPEERTVGAYWRSMYVKCGVEAPVAGLLDPSVLGDLLVKPGGG